MNFKLKELLAVPLLVMLTSCGGSGGFSGGTGGDTGGDVDEDDAVGDISLALGILDSSGIASFFTPDAIKLSVDRLSAGGQTTATVNIVNDLNDSLFTESTQVAFTSNCVEQGLATISSPVTTSTGTAQTLYTANGCVGSDTIIASISSGATASGNLIVAPAELGELAFNTATPTTIGLKNLSNPVLRNVSEVRFQLLDKTQTPIRGERILFTLDTAQGATDATLTNEFDTTDAEGFARAFVSGGSEKGSIRVIATVESDTSLTNQSDVITISTGIATQRSMSLSLSTFNPWSWELDGATVVATLRVSDFYNNPVADGTKVLFFTSHGQIQPECELVDGACAVNWTSQAPRATSTDIDLIYGGDIAIPGDTETLNSASNYLGLFLKDDDGLSAYDYIGKVAIMATLKGEETTRPDANSNGLFDESEGYVALSEAYLDFFKNDSYDDGDTYIDWNNDGNFSQAPSDTFRGARCSATAKANGHCAALADISDTIYFDMSALVSPFGIRAYTGEVVTGAESFESTISVLGTAFFTIVVEDINGNSPAGGSTVSYEVTPATDNTTIEVLTGGGDVPTFSRGPFVDGVSFRLKETDIITPGAFVGTVDVSVTNPDDSISRRSIVLRLPEETTTEPPAEGNP